MEVSKKDNVKKEKDYGALYAFIAFLIFISVIAIFALLGAYC